LRAASANAPHFFVIRRKHPAAQVEKTARVERARATHEMARGLHCYRWPGRHAQRPRPTPARLRLAAQSRILHFTR
jgi:hypothetical protein